MKKFIIDPMDLSVEEIDDLIALANDSSNLVHVQDYLLKVLCYHLEERY